MPGRARAGIGVGWQCASAAAGAQRHEQLAAVVGAADPKNPALTLIAGFCAKNVQNGNRAAQE